MRLRHRHHKARSSSRVLFQAFAVNSAFQVPNHFVVGSCIAFRTVKERRIYFIQIQRARRGKQRFIEMGGHHFSNQPFMIAVGVVIG